MNECKKRVAVLGLQSTEAATYDVTANGPTSPQMTEAPIGKDHRNAPCTGSNYSLEASTDDDTLRDSWRRILLLTWTYLMVHRRICYTFPSRVCLLAIVLITARCLLHTKLSYVPMAVSKPNENSTLLDSFFERLSNGTSELRQYSHKNETLTSVERGDNIAVIRVGQNASTDPHYRLSWRAAAANDDGIQENSTLDINIETNDQEMRYFFQKIVIDFVKVSILSTRAVVLSRHLAGDHTDILKGSSTLCTQISRSGSTRIRVRGMALWP